MKICPNCATSLPDFVNVCTKCKFNLASAPLPRPPAGPAPSAQTSSPPSRVSSASPASHQSNQEHVSSSSEASLRLDAPPKNKKFVIYAAVGIIVLAVLGWLGSSKSDSDGNKPIKDQANAQAAKAKSPSSAARPAAPDVNQIMRDAANKPSNNSTPNRAKDVKNSEGANANKPWYQQ